MLYSEVSSRYASALHSWATEGDKQDKVFNDLRHIRKLINEDQEIKEFLHSPLIKPSAKEELLKKSFEKGQLAEETVNFILTLARKNRIGLFSEVVDAYQAKSDEANGVTRGRVRSTNVLTPEEREEIEKIVSKVTGKRVILSYEEDSNLIGGLIAEVGSYTFDDTLTSHLRILKEDLKRRAH